MDRFEEMAERLAGMAGDDLKKTVASLVAQCACGKCPAYHDGMRGRKEALFCELGKSGSGVTGKACACPTCPVTPRMGLRHAHYCLKGSEKEIRGL